MFHAMSVRALLFDCADALLVIAEHRAKRDVCNASGFSARRTLIFSLSAGGMHDNCSMRIDLYTKAVLTIIAIALAVIASNQIVSPRVASAQGTFAGLQFTSGGGWSYFFDSRTGEIWSYSIGDGKMQAKRRLTKIGQPMVVEK
jgi:hypothetical protein